MNASQFCLDTKRTKKIKSPEMLLAHKAFHAQIQKRCWAGIFLPGYPVPRRSYMQKFPMPCPTHRPAAFLDFSRSLSADGEANKYVVPNLCSDSFPAFSA